MKPTVIDPKTTACAEASALDGAAFRSFYYLKRELADFCKENGLPNVAVDSTTGDYHG